MTNTTPSTMSLLPRLRAFALSNGVAISLSLLSRSLIMSSSAAEVEIGSSNNSSGSSGSGSSDGMVLLCVSAYLACVVKILVIVGLLTWTSRGKLAIGEGEKEEERNVGVRSKAPRKDGEIVELVLRALCIGAVFEAAGCVLAQRWFVQMKGDDIAPLHFLATSFVFEIIFDFFHYWAHRTCHIYPWLYQNIHRTHHKYLHPTPLATYHQDPLDVILTNTLPLMLSLCVLEYALGMRFSCFEFHLQMTYKTFVEVAGHTGVQAHASSFPQFMLLPRALGFELYTDDHDAHHTSGGSINFSKRFILWDKVFGTWGGIKFRGQNVKEIS